MLILDKNLKDYVLKVHGIILTNEELIDFKKWFNEIETTDEEILHELISKYLHKNAPRDMYIMLEEDHSSLREMIAKLKGLRK